MSGNDLSTDHRLVRRGNCRHWLDQVLVGNSRRRRHVVHPGRIGYPHAIDSRPLWAVVGSRLVVGSYILLSLVKTIIQCLLERLSIPLDCLLFSVLLAEVITELIRCASNTGRLRLRGT